MSERMSDERLTNIAERHKYTIFMTFDSEFDPESQPVSNGNAIQCHVDRDELLQAIKTERAEVERLEAKIDELMLEYCPDEMTPEQVAEWAKHQVPAQGQSDD